MQTLSMFSSMVGLRYKFFTELFFLVVENDKYFHFKNLQQIKKCVK